MDDNAFTHSRTLNITNLSEMTCTCLPELLDGRIPSRYSAISRSEIYIICIGTLYFICTVPDVCFCGL